MKSNSLMKSFQFAMTGLLHVFYTQRNMKIHLLAAAGVFALAWRLDFSTWEYAILTIAVGMVWVTEVLNTAIEVVVDLASPEIHPLAKKAKDIAAGAVLISAVMSVIIGGLLFGPYIKG